jgi:hypothetical protein
MQRFSLFVFAALAATIILFTTPSSAGAAKTAAKDTWAFQGSLSDACQCDVFCPCEFAQKPSYGHCDDTAIIHVDRGHYGDVTLDGMRVVVVSQSPEGERLVDTVGRLNFAHLYVPEQATDAQTHALAMLARQVFGQWVNGKVARISPEESVRKVAMEVDIQPTRHRVRIPNVLDLDIEALVGWDGKNPVKVSNGPAAGPGVGDILIAHSNTYRFTDHDIDWNYGGRSASMRTMNLSGSTKYVPADPEPAATGAKTDHTHSHHH